MTQTMHRTSTLAHFRRDHGGPIVPRPSYDPLPAVAHQSVREVVDLTPMGRAGSHDHQPPRTPTRPPWAASRHPRCRMPVLRATSRCSWAELVRSFRDNPSRCLAVPSDRASPLRACPDCSALRSSCQIRKRGNGHSSASSDLREACSSSSASLSPQSSGAPPRLLSAGFRPRLSRSYGTDPLSPRTCPKQSVTTTLCSGNSSVPQG